MVQDYRKMFIKSESSEVGSDLFNKVMQRIEQKQRHLFFRKIIVFSLGLVGSGAALLPVGQIMLAEFSQSNFCQFFSLLFSDLTSVMAYSGSFISALLESLPLLSITMFLVVIFIFFASLKSLVIIVSNSKRLIFN